MSAAVLAPLSLRPIQAGADTGIPSHVDPRPEVAYTGPSMPWLIENKKLAHQIIATSTLPEPERILDDTELAFLKKYVEEGEEHALKGKGLWDDERGEANMENVRDSGSLVAFAIVKRAFDGEGMELLRRWFERDAM